MKSVNCKVTGDLNQIIVQNKLSITMPGKYRPDISEFAECVE